MHLEGIRRYKKFYGLNQDGYRGHIYIYIYNRFTPRARYVNTIFDKINSKLIFLILFNKNYKI